MIVLLKQKASSLGARLVLNLMIFLPDLLPRTRSFDMKNLDVLSFSDPNF